MLARSAVAGLTERLGARTNSRPAGKTWVDPRGKQGMITHQSLTNARPAPCHSPGPPLDVVEWRLCRLREAGLPPDLAESLASGRVDLHALLELVDAGCPPELAARILSPLDDAVATETPRAG